MPTNANYTVSGNYCITWVFTIKLETMTTPTMEVTDVTELLMKVKILFSQFNLCKGFKCILNCSIPVYSYFQDICKKRLYQSSAV